ncbi:MAG: aspartate/glutamate racemase family protein [Phycisphaerales bacterium]
MPKHIGIVAVSPEGSSICYRLIGRHIAQLQRAGDRPTVTLHNKPFQSYVEALQLGDWAAIGHMLAESAEALAGAGADFCILPDNVAHHAIQIAESESPIPWINMIELVAEAVRAQQCERVGLIGTRYVMYGSTYQTALGLRGIPLLVPEDEAAAQINEIIFGEAVYGQVSAASQGFVAEQIRHLRQRGCDALILGSSEAALMLGDANAGADQPMPVFDPLPLLAEAAVRMAVQP